MSPAVATLVSVGVPLALVVLLFVNTGPEQPLRLRQLWITPVVAVLSISAALVWQRHGQFGPVAWGGFAAAAVVGLTTGTLRAGTVKMRIDQDTGQLLSRTTSYALVLFVGLLGFRLITVGMPGDKPIAAFDAALVFAMAMIVAQRLGIFRRAVRLLRQASSTA
jgi:hypothetical protein